MAGGPEPFDGVTNGIQNSDEDEAVAGMRSLGVFRLEGETKAVVGRDLQYALAHRKCWDVSRDFDACMWTPTQVIVYFKKAPPSVVPTGGSPFPMSRRDIKMKIGGQFLHCETLFVLQKLEKRRNPPWLPAKPKPKGKPKRKGKGKGKGKGKAKQRTRTRKRPERVGRSSQSSCYDTDDPSGAEGPGNNRLDEMFMARNPRKIRKKATKHSPGQTCQVVVAVKSKGIVRLIDKITFDHTWLCLTLVGMSKEERELCFDAQIAALHRPFSTNMSYNNVTRFLGCGFLATGSRSLLPMEDSHRWRLPASVRFSEVDEGIESIRDDDYDSPELGVFCSQLLLMSLYETMYEVKTVAARSSTPESAYVALTALVAKYTAQDSEHSYEDD